jgi:hypothetical protein
VTSVETLPAPDVAAAAAQAIDAAAGPAPEPAAKPAAPPEPAAQPAAAAEPAVEPAAQPAPAASGASGALIQIGFFSVEANAKRAVDTLAKAGITAKLRQEDSNGKPYWSVTARGDKATLAAIKAAGFADAYILKK